MLTINASIGTETQGLLLDDTIVQNVMGSLNDAQKVEITTELFKGILAIKIQGLTGVSLQAAVDYVEAHTTIQT